MHVAKILLDRGNEGVDIDDLYDQYEARPR